MNKEKLMQMISEAIDKGAWINIHQAQYDIENDVYSPVSKSQAVERIKGYQEALGVNEMESDINSFTIIKDHIRITTSYKDYMIEDVDFSGGEEIA